VKRKGERRVKTGLVPESKRGEKISIREATRLEVVKCFLLRASAKERKK
jgi:hypothetical protein